MKKLTMIITMLLITSAVFAYQPLTIDEADNYLDSVTYEEVRDIVIDYDYIEHTVPTITLPKVEYLLIGNDLLITPTDNIIISHSNFKWSIDYPQDTIYNFKQEEKQGISTVALITSVIGALLIGYVIGDIL
jgi:hypothetical protein